MSSDEHNPGGVPPTGNNPNEVAPGRKSSALYNGNVRLADCQLVNLEAAERFRILRAKIDRLNLAQNEHRIIAITSAVPSEGKSLVAVNLARAFGLDPINKVLIIDCDLRRPRVHNYFGLSESPGLSDVLVAGKPMPTVIRPGERGVDVISAGSPVADPTRAIEQPILSSYLAELKKRYRYIVLDCPPVLLCPEPITLSSIAEGTLMVVRAWATEKKLVRDAIGVIGKKSIMGLVMNDGYEASREYQYYGYYGHDRIDGRSEEARETFADKGLNLGERIGDKGMEIGKSFAGKIVDKIRGR